MNSNSLATTTFSDTLILKKNVDANEHIQNDAPFHVISLMKERLVRENILIQKLKDD